MNNVMRGLLSIFLSFALFAGLSACSGSKGGAVQPPPQGDTTDSDGGNTDGDSDTSLDGDGNSDTDTDSDTDDDSQETQLGGLGEDCFADEECISSLCVEKEILDPDQCSDLKEGEICGFCSQQCLNTGDCAGTDLGLVCNDFQVPGSSGDFIKACVQTEDITCTRCENSQGTAAISACSPELGNNCLEFIDGFFCTLNCNGNPDICPEGTECLSEYSPSSGNDVVDLPFAQCVPTAAQCTACYDPDGDGYGVGTVNPEDENACLGIDCDESDTAINEGAIEICDLAGVDSNCDGLPNPVGLDFSTDVNNCGECQNACTPQNAVPACVAAICGIDACNEFYYDLNDSYADGCEYECINQNLSITDVPDLDRTDTDCDGIDGSVAEAIFVSAAFGANNANPGTRAQPVRDVWKGIELAEAAGKSQVLVTSGTFVGPADGPVSSGTTVMRDGVSVFGGYDQATWARNPVNNVTLLASNASVALRFAGTAQETRLSGLTVRGASFTGTDSRSTFALWLQNTGANAVLEEIIVQAGNASSGSNGSGGDNGPAGQAGSSPSSSSSGYYIGGNGGGSACGAGGGKGGNGTADPAGRGGAGGNGGDGTAVGNGGAGGSGNSNDWVGEGTGDSGDGGGNGGDGGPGTGGVSPYASTGTFDVASMVWLAPQSSAGIDGKNGGGGGGAGAGAKNDKNGGGGGGGGSAGCGGNGGASGTPGGGSFGIVILGASNPEIVAVSIVRGNAGDGGRGGNGGDGGAGQSGAAGFNPSKDGGFLGIGEKTPGTGANGGSGGDGGGGGGGAGGCGGPSIGVALGAGADIEQSEVEIISGEGGAGGSAGTGGRRDGAGTPAPSGASGCGGALVDFQTY